MPIYVYEVVTEDDSPGQCYEIMQPMTADALTKHPETGEKIQRVPTAPNLPATWSDGATKSKLSNKNLDRLGFTKYERAGDGNYEKKSGKGPDVISS
jgi:hypothetical protein